MNDREAFSKMFSLHVDTREHYEEERARLEQFGLRLALAVALLHQGKHDEAELIISDVRILGKHPYELTPVEFNYLKEVATRALP